MALRLKELKGIVKSALVEESTVSALRAEVTRVLGPSVLVEGNVAKVAAEVNDRLEVLERTGRARTVSFDPKIVSKLIESHSVEARKLAARTVPVHELRRMVNDRDASVRALVARRVPIKTVKEMIKRHPDDDALLTVLRQRRIEEAGLPKPKEVKEPFDYHGEGRLGDAVKQHEGPELSDVFYETLAARLIKDYGGNIEGQWEEAAVHRYVSSTRATSGVAIDEERLYKALKDQLEEKEEKVIERNSLKELAARLRREHDEELLAESNVSYTESVDLVEELLSSELSMNEYIERANKLFSVRESTAPLAIKKYRVNEGSVSEHRVPCVGRLPHSHGFRSLDERALDTYCRHWNARQSMSGEPLRLEWSTHPDAVGKISFNVTLR